MRWLRPYVTALYAMSAILGGAGATVILSRLQRPFTPFTAVEIGVSTAYIAYAMCFVLLTGDHFSAVKEEKKHLYFIIAICGAVALISELPGYTFSFPVAFLAVTTIAIGLPLVHYLAALAVLSIASLADAAVARDLLRAEIWVCLIAAATAVKVVVRTLHRNLVSQGKLLDQARWSASRLSSITLRLDSTVNQERFKARVSERKRLARAVHDSVGYSLTALIVQLSALQNRVDDAMVLQKLSYLEDFARNLLRDTRIVVSEIRETPPVTEQDWPSQWRKLCEVFGDCTGVRVHREITIDFPVAQDVGAVVYRVIQEGLTNSYRHGHAKYVAVTALYDRRLGMILLKISDNGRGAEFREVGNGLRGMQERVESVNGSFLWQTQPDRGFDIAVDIPYTFIEYEEQTQVAGS